MRSLFALSIHFFLCLPLLLFPSTLVRKALAANLCVLYRSIAQTISDFVRKFFHLALYSDLFFSNVFITYLLSILQIPAIVHQHDNIILALTARTEAVSGGYVALRRS